MVVFRGCWVVIGALVTIGLLVLGTGAASAARVPVDRAVSPSFELKSSVKTVKVGKNPNDATFDPSNGDVYVTNSNSSSVSVIDGSTNKVTKTITVGADPIEAAYDSTNQEVYIVSQTSGTVTVISNSNSVVTTITVVADPIIGLVEPDGNLYVTCHGASVAADGDVAVINESTNKVTEVSVGEDAGVPNYDPANGDVYVVNILSSTLSAISSALKVTTISVGTDALPLSMAYSTKTKDMYVSLVDAGRIDAISSKNKIVAKIADSNGPEVLTYDPANEDLYAPDSTYPTSGNLTIVGSANSVIETIKTPAIEPLGFLDSSNGDYYLGTLSGDDLVYNSAATPTLVTTLTVGKLPLYAENDPATGDVLILKYAGTGDDGAVLIFTSANSLVTTDTVGKGGITLAYDSSNQDVYVANYGAATVSVIT